MTDVYGNEHAGKIVEFKKGERKIRVSLLSPYAGVGSQQIMIESRHPDLLKYEIISMDGRCVTKGIVKLSEGTTRLPVSGEWMATALYLFRAQDELGNKYTLLFRKD
jgi:hypothetical protein